MGHVLGRCQQGFWYSHVLVMKGSVIGHMVLAIKVTSGHLVFFSCQTQILSKPGSCDQSQSLSWLSIDWDQSLCSKIAFL